MSIQWWSEPVRVSVDGRNTINVTDNERAARFLLEEWPGERGPRHLRARHTILRSMERPNDPGTLIAARMAFEAAVDEAGMLMPEPPKSMASPEFRSPSWRKQRRRA